MIDVKVPEDREGSSAVVRNWLRNVGDHVSENDALVELETDKATQEICAPVTGILVEVLLSPDAEALPGMVLCRIEADNAARGTIDQKNTATKSFEAFLSPAVQRVARQHGIDLAGISGTGRNGRITKGDIDAAVAARGGAPTLLKRESFKADDVEIVPHDRMRLAIARNMVNSFIAAPHVTAVFEADFSALLAHRSKHAEAFASEGLHLTITAYLVMAAAAAMSTAPAVNSRWYDDHLEIFKEVNIGIGTALPQNGLVVPVIRHVQTLSLRETVRKLTDLTARARAGKLSVPDMKGGTFTISNHGISGSLFAAPVIINRPQSAIWGVGKVEKRAVVRQRNGADVVEVRPMCYVSLTIDHRVLDGHQTNSWLTKFVQTLESWPVD